VEKFILDMKLF